MQERGGSGNEQFGIIGRTLSEFALGLYRAGSQNMVEPKKL